MHLLFAQIARLLSGGAPAVTQAGVANILLQRAEDRGQSAFETRQLRQAALAYLSVVR